jgi:hypothetical protein
MAASTFLVCCFCEEGEFSVAVSADSELTNRSFGQLAAGRRLAISLSRNLKPRHILRTLNADSGTWIQWNEIFSSFPICKIVIFHLKTTFIGNISQHSACLIETQSLLEYFLILFAQNKHLLVNNLNYQK